MVVVAAEQARAGTVARPAGLGSRLAAYLLDWLVTFILGCLFTAAAGLLLLIASDMGRRDPSDRAFYAAPILASFVVPAWSVITLAGWARWGRSVGKLALNLRVVDRRGAVPGMRRALVRLVVYIMENLPAAALAPAVAAALLLRSHPLLPPLLAALGVALVAPLLSVALVLRDRSHRALHDLAAGTLVIAEQD